MSEISPAGAHHEAFTAWAKQQGVQINGVGPASISDQGLGIVAQRRIEAGEVLCDVPASALLTINTIPEDFRKKHEGIAVHGVLASFLAFGDPDTSRFSFWKNSWPSMQDFQESMPILWPLLVREPLDDDGNPHYTTGQREKPAFILPPAIAGRWAHDQMREFWRVRDTAAMYRQEKKLKADWDIVSKVFPDETLPEYIYYWLIVNTRSFYFEVSGKEAAQNHDDCMVLCPFIDYFNHSDQGCRVDFSEKGYTVTSDRTYESGEQIFTSYGSEKLLTSLGAALLLKFNDFLLCEYGFILKNNRYDCLPLDDFFSGKQISDNAKNSLEKFGYLGNYTLDSDGVCFRTQVAIRRQTLNTYRWKKFMAGVDTEDEESRVAVTTLLHHRILLPYQEEAVKTLQQLERTGDAIPPDAIPPGAKATLTQRWKQIRDMVQQALLIHGVGTV